MRPAIDDPAAVTAPTAQAAAWGVMGPQRRKSQAKDCEEGSARHFYGALLACFPGSRECLKVGR